MTPQLFREIALIPALDLLPVSMDSRAAQAMVIAICLQESGLINRRQIDGPARGYAQFERSGGVTGVLTHSSSKLFAVDVCKKLDYPPTVAAVYEAIEHNDVLAAAFARLLLWTLTGALPQQHEYDKSWKYYISAWRPGKPHRETWNGYYDLAWGGCDVITTLLLLLKQFWKPLAIVIGVMLLVLFGYWIKHNYDEGKIEQGRAEIRAEWEKDKARRIQMVTDQTNLWDLERQKHEKAIKDRDEQHELRIKEARALVAKLPRSVARTAVPASVVQLLNDAASNTGPFAASTSRAAKTVPPVATASDD